MAIIRTLTEKTGENMNENTEKLSFEQAMSRLDEITALLRDGKTELSESVGLYSEGVALAAKCRRELDEAKLKISVIEEE